MLAPALGFLPQELWVSAPDRNRYRAAVEQIVGDHQGDPVLRSAVGRPELPETAADTVALVRDVRSGGVRAITVLGHVTAALAVRLEDDAVVLLPPWINLAGALAGGVERGTSRWCGGVAPGGPRRAGGCRARNARPIRSPPPVRVAQAAIMNLPALSSRAPWHRVRLGRMASSACPFLRRGSHLGIWHSQHTR